MILSNNEELKRIGNSACKILHPRSPLSYCAAEFFVSIPLVNSTRRNTYGAITCNSVFGEKDLQNEKKII